MTQARRRSRKLRRGPKSSKSSKKTRNLRITQFLMRGLGTKRSPLKKKKKTHRLRVSKMQELQQVQEAQDVQEIQAFISTPSFQPQIQPPQALEALAPVLPAPQSPFNSFNLSTSDVLRPNDRLKQSIEAFILDQRSPHTRKAYGKDLKRFVKFLHLRNHHQGPETLNRTLVIAYKEFLITEGLEHTSVDRHLATLRSFFKWLVDDGVIEKSPAEGVRFLNPKRLSTTQGFSDEEVKKILSLPNLHSRTGSQHYAVLMVLFYCGLRRSELCSLRTTFLGTERNQKVLKLRGKGNAERMIVVIPAVWNALKHYFYITHRSFTEDQFLFVPLRNNRTGILKKPLDPSTIFYIVTRYAKMAGIAHRVSPHSCRATAISNARDHHVPDRAIQEFAGWASPDMITRYDKRKTSVEESASHAISYGAENRMIPVASSSLSSALSSAATPSVATTEPTEGREPEASA